MRIIDRDVVGAFIVSADDQMLLQRHLPGGLDPDVWRVVGGGIELGETGPEAVVREIGEEVGIDASDAEITQIGEPHGGQGEKKLETGEKVLVRMTFFDYLVRLPMTAADVQLNLGVEIAETNWFPINQPAPEGVTIAPSTLSTIRLLGLGLGGDVE